MTFLLMRMAAIVAAMGWGVAYAYDPSTHRALSRAAVAQSVLGDNSSLPSGKRAKLGFPYHIDDGFHQSYRNSLGNPQPILELFADGAHFEDDVPRSMHHFFDPVAGRALHVEPDDPRLFPIVVPGLGDITSIALADFNLATQTSPDWALGTTRGVPIFLNNYDLKKARDYFYQAMVWPSETERRRNTGLMFESLGRIVHHLQDMAQPQHVRNDFHLHLDSLDNSCDPNSVLPWCAFYWRFRAPSTYENWTKDVQTPLPMAGYAPVYGPPTADGNTTFGQPRQFWINAGKGMAEYTNRNFVSAGTTGVSPPTVAAPFDMLARDLCNGAVPPCEVADLDHYVTFWQNALDDGFRPATNGVNPYAVSASIYEWDFRRYAPGIQPVRTVNRFTFGYDHAYLLPRAVGYSAGLINYFFRGDMEIALPPEGVYAIVDTRSTNCGGACFQKLKLKVRNTTPNDDMGAGALRAVVKYHRNTCFKADLSGEYGGPAFAGATCRDVVDRVAVSDAVGVATVDRAFGANAIEFTFPAGAGIPIDASDIYLQVVFRGVLGQEADAVAVTTKDIAEPNFIAVANMTDYVYDDLGDNLYHPVPTGSALGVSNLGIAFGANTTPLVTMPGMGGGEHAQVAFLTDVSELPATVFFSGYKDASWVLEPEEFTLDDATGRFARSCPVYLARGVYREYQYWFFHRTSDHGAISVRQLSARDQPSSSAGASARMHPEIVYGCGVPTGGIYDFSAMTPFAPAAALPWSSNF